MFQFPSNGKAYPKSKARSTKDLSRPSFNSLQTGRHIQSYISWYPMRGYIKVSIPFKREGISKVQYVRPNVVQLVSFNSLQTGRHIQSLLQSFADGSPLLFQFPSNGKAYPKFNLMGSGIILPEVSIPFKREGISKDRCSSGSYKRY